MRLKFTNAPVLSRVKQKIILIVDLIHLSMLTQSLRKAFFYLQKDYSLDLILCHFRGFKFFARRTDWPVLREIFFHREYHFIKYLFDKDAKIKFSTLDLTLERLP
jgi:hypothetical protein